MADERLIPTDRDTHDDPDGTTDAPTDQDEGAREARGPRRSMDRRHRRRHRGHHGRGPKGRRRHRVDWDDVDALERYQRHLEQREADVQAKITRVRDRINELTTTEPIGG